MKPLFQVGSVVVFGPDEFRVVRYRKYAGCWEVEFANVVTGGVQYVPCKILETFV